MTIARQVFRVTPHSKQMTNRKTQTDQQVLEAFLLDNPDIARLEAMLDEFNLPTDDGELRVRS